MAHFHKPLVTAAVIVVVVALFEGSLSAQYFGQNKVQYRTFDFQVLKTEHFDLHYYPEEELAARAAARMAERWYTRLSRVLDHQLSGRQTLILYASHPHFAQTNVIEGMLGVGTGGVTESLQRRIVMPVGGGPAETDHVLGHELVHAFQYDILGPNLNLPLWFIEGMAEYLSIGSTDPHTAVWLRDAALSERLPDVKDLDDPDYFPYRFGHAFWAYVAGRWGDAAISQILHIAGGPRGRGQRAPGARDPIDLIEGVLGVEEKVLSAEWHASVVNGMVRPLGDRAPTAGRRIIEPSDEQELNVGPVLSPDGSRIAFLSSRDRLSIDLFVADAVSGRIERKVISTAVDPHFDSLQFISSAGAWDPAGRRLVIAAIHEGRPVLAIVDTNSGRREREFELPGVDEVFHPAWSPNGMQIAFSGLSGGVSDLWLMDVETGAIRKLTNDAYADLHPAWSPDGRRLIFSSDRFSSDLDVLRFGDYELSVIEASGGAPVRIPGFEGARHISPQWGRDGTIYFIANPDGVPDVYRLAGEGGPPRRVTRLMTGVTGITAASPALSLALNGSRLAAIVYRNATYEIQAIEGPPLAGNEPAPTGPDTLGARLAPRERSSNVVDRLLASPGAGLPQASDEPVVEDYKPRLALNYIGQELGVSANTGIGGYVGGGITLNFSDTLGDRMLTSLFQVNGSFEDFGGQVGYLNRKRRWNWGGLVEQIPYVTGAVLGSLQTVNGQRVLVEQQIRDRQIDRRVMGVAAYPFSRARRFEIGASVRHLTFNRHLDTRGFSVNTGDLLFEDSQKTPLGEPLTLGELSMAFVHDTSIFGPTGPILGHRSRFEVTPAWGDLSFTSVIADARHYAMPFRPWTVAGRFLHIGRYGADSESTRLYPLFIGFENLVRGYGLNTFDIDECQFTGETGCSVVDQFVGSRLAVAGVELRAPLVGAFTGDLEYGPIPAEIVAFFDAGVAWDDLTRPSGFGSGTRPWARSYGAGIRFNAFGYLILEVDAVRALDRPRDNWRLVFGLRPGF